ncbi:MAG: HDOD domain-containing protein [Deltaproteobacteria bacterium]|nr:HDOD domain-containing protein [Deltaproteobacteria bacterium]
MSNTSNPQLEDVILKVMELPVLPVTAQKVLGLMSDPDVSIEKIKRIVSIDPGLATKILKIANSAFLAEKLLWEQMIGSAIAAGIIARKSRVADPEDAFIGGLLHDIGMVVLNNEFPDKFAKVMEKVYNDEVSFSTAETEVFEFTHREVGALVVRKWGFPENIEFLLRNFDNHEVVSKERWMHDLVTIITMADRVCQKFGMGWHKPHGDDVDFGDLPETLGLTGVALDEALEMAQGVFKQELDSY